MVFWFTLSVYHVLEYLLLSCLKIWGRGRWRCPLLEFRDPISLPVALIPCCLYIAIHVTWILDAFLLWNSSVLFFGGCIFLWKQIGKIPVDEIKKDLKSAGVSEEAVEELLQVLSIKSLTKLEGWVFWYCHWEIILCYFWPNKVKLVVIILLFFSFKFKMYILESRNSTQ